MAPSGPPARLEVFAADSAADDRAAHRGSLHRSFEMVLTNVSKWPLWVPSYISYERPSPVQGWVELSGPSGPLSMACLACGGRTPPYRVLYPGEQLRMKEDLWCFGPLFEPGLYTITAAYSPSLVARTYFNGHSRDRPPAPPRGVDILTEDVVSEAVHFQVRAPPP
jgi:hypothetical protein